MKIMIRLLTVALLVLGACQSAQAQYGVPIILGRGLVEGIAAQREIARLTTTEATYRGQTYLRKRSTIEVRSGDAAGQIEQTEAQLDLCHAALLADSTGITCPREREALIRANLKYVDRVRPTWIQHPYRQELKLYLAEDTRRSRAKATSR